MVRVFIYLSQLLGIFAVAMLVPAVIGLLTHDRATADGFMLAAALTAFLSGAIFFALRGRRGRLDRVAGFMLVLAIWVLPPIVGAIPLMRPAGVDYLTALFEAASGYTTTGASALPTLRGIGFAAVFWRAELQWLGGLMTLVTIVMLLAPTQIGGIPNRQLPLIGSVGERRAATPGNILPTVLAIAAAYSAATAICVVLLLATGIPPFDAVCLALSTVSTGGFMPMNGGLYLYRNAGAEFVIMVFMMIGATSILWHRMMAPGRWRLVKEHRESYWVVGVVVTVGIAYAIAITRSSDVPSFLYPLTALRQGLFTAASLVSTTGFHARLHGFATLPLLIVLFLAIIGGGAFSTAGGLKFFRIGGMLVAVAARIAAPHLSAQRAPHPLRQRAL